MSRCDVVVVGGGMVGATAATLLAKAGLRVAVVEAGVQPVSIADDDVDLRVSAVSRSSQRILETAHAWDGIQPARRSAYHRMRVWDAEVPPESEAVLEFDAAEVGEPDLGHIIENRLIVASLHARLGELAEVDVYAPARLERLRLDSDRATVVLDDGRRLRCALVVGADGAGSRTRELAGIETRGWPYDQQAVVTHVATERPHEATAWQRFLTTGPIALLPLYDGRSSIVWSTTPQHARALLAMDEPAFNDAVADAGDRVLGAVRASAGRASFPLQLQHAVSYTATRLALIGDAAHAVHPLAGQGVNLGMLDAAALADVLAAGVSAGADAGDTALLRRYERRRKSENLMMMAALDGLKRLFGNDHPLVGRARQAGMAVLNRLTPAKGLLIRRAMGMDGELRGDLTA